MSTSKKHKSAQDFKNLRMVNTVKKMGGQDMADQVRVQWDNHRQSEGMSERRKREADGFLRGIIVSNKISREEAAVFFKIGRYRYDRLRNMNPTLPIPQKRPADHRVTAEDKELVRIFMKAQATEPGYPCQHRSTPVYIEDPQVTFVSLYKDYIVECKERQVRVLCLATFRRIVKFIMPTLHLGRTKTDTCNSCFSLDLQIKDPETSETLRNELKAAKEVHVEEAVRTRRAISKLIKTVQKEVAPNDAPLTDEPIYIPSCFSDPFDRLNRTFVVDHIEGTVGDEDEVINDGLEILSDRADDDDQIEPDVEVGEGDGDECRDGSDGTISRKLRISVQDYGSGIPLPHYGATQPNHDYYASNLTLHNMNFVNCATGNCNIFYYDERVAGKDGSCVSSLRWKETTQFMMENKENIPTAECKVLDNCVGQNKSNTTHKFSMMNSLLLFQDGVTDIYFRVGHSHNQSDMKTAHAKKALAKKNLYTPQAVAAEVNKVTGVSGQVLDDRDGVFMDWKLFLDKHFPNMDPGFTSFFIFEFKNGVVEYKELDEDGIAVTVKSKVFCQDTVGTRKIILRELFNLSSTSNVLEICKANPRLPPLPMRRVSQKKIDNMKTLYQEIPRNFRWFYPEGSSVRDDPHTELRARAALRGLVPAVRGQLDAQQDHGNQAAMRGVTAVVGQLAAQQGQDYHHELPVPPVHIGPVSAMGEHLVDMQEFGLGDEVELYGRVDHGVVNNVTVEPSSSLPKRKPGRPKKGPNLEINQPAIYRYFVNANRQQPEASQEDLEEEVEVVQVNPKKKVVNYIEDSSDSEEYGSLQKKRKKFIVDSDSDDDFLVEIDEYVTVDESTRNDDTVEAGLADDVTLEASLEDDDIVEASQEDDDIVEASQEDDETKDDTSEGDAEDEYRLDFNHNRGSLFLKLKKK